MEVKVILKVGDTFIFISNGFFSIRWPALDFWLQVLLMAGIQINVIFLPVPFVYRYFNVCRYANWLASTY